jgi:hypothetical protein
MIRRGKE